MRVRKTLGAMAVAVVAAAGVSTTAGPAGASSQAATASTSTVSTSTASASARFYCRFGGRGKAPKNLTIYESTVLISNPVGGIPKGKVYNCDYGVTGSKYTMCGRTWNRWEYVSYNGKKGYIVAACAKPAS
ncbi:hypothetical protein E1292_34115 [Nonomuraea deserti]|uniref:SH3 domain-containing protein n=1 Tax=Nonomuraea deserti TaxID=1848322 RepID=A0A4R4VAA8_9ACTN|nr:hypothetical protein [Nonomuraea deserti]TDC98773.1 hypothetical protein E1292_34115 [Nonomuraea deserti]